MKGLARYVAIGLLAGLPVWAQQDQKQDEPPQDQPSTQQQQPEQRPTLGPAPAPTLGGGAPRTATTTNYRKLMRIRTLFVDRMDNSLNDKLVMAIGKSGRFRIVDKAKDADATLRGSCLESRRLKRVHTEVFISDRTGASVWQDNLYRPYNPPALEKAVSDTATIVAEHLDASVREAERK